MSLILYLPVSVPSVCQSRYIFLSLFVVRIPYDCRCYSQSSVGCSNFVYQFLYVCSTVRLSVPLGQSVNLVVLFNSDALMRQLHCRPRQPLRSLSFAVWTSVVIPSRLASAADDFLSSQSLPPVRRSIQLPTHPWLQTSLLTSMVPWGRRSSPKPSRRPKQEEYCRRGIL